MIHSSIQWGCPIEDWWFHENYQGIEFDVAGPPCENPCNHIGNSQNSMAPTVSQMVMPKTSYAHKVIYPMGVPGSDGNHVSESPSEIPSISLASQLQEIDYYSILDIPSLTLWSKGKENHLLSLPCLGNKPGPTWTPPHSHKLNDDLTWISKGKHYAEGYHI